MDPGTDFFEGDQRGLSILEVVARERAIDSGDSVAPDLKETRVGLHEPVWLVSAGMRGLGSTKLPPLCPPVQGVITAGEFDGFLERSLRVEFVMVIVSVEDVVGARHQRQAKRSRVRVSPVADRPGPVKSFCQSVFACK